MKPISTRKFTFLFFLLSMMFSGVAFSQNVRTVCPGGCDFTTIQAAANASNSNDVIVIMVEGTHTEKNITLPEKNLTIRGLGKTTTILQSAASRASVSGGRIFTYNPPTGSGNNQITLEDMTIQYAYAPLTDMGGGLFQSVGGVFYAKGTLKGLKVSANNVRFYANETTGGNNLNSGGACFYFSATGSGFTYNADLSINNCDFVDNKVGNSTGTSLSDGPCFNLLGGPARLTINNSTFTSNNGYTRGGVIYCGSTWEVNISNSLFESNTARNGDGGCFSARSGSAWIIDNCLFKNNSAVFQFVVNGTNGYGGVAITKGAKYRNCTFYGNSAVKGGALYRVNTGTGEELQLINCTFYGNSASSAGRTLVVGSAASGSAFPLVMVNTIVTGGSGTASSDIHFIQPYNNFTVNVKNYCNSISCENVSPGTTPVFDFNSGNSSLNMSTTLADNGGPTQSLALASNSSLRDAGICATGVTYEIPVKDQRNYSRTDGMIDIGAMEYNGIIDHPGAPSISYAALGSTLSTGDRTITATIADINGVHWYPQFTDKRPRIYFKRNNDGWKSDVGTWTDGSGINGTWNFTISAAAMGGLANGDQVHYYIIAQDVSTTPVIHSVPSGVVANTVNDIVAPPVPHSYIIGSTLPVKIESFTVNRQDRNAKVQWVVSDEENFSHYEVERSQDGQHWATISKVYAANRRNYAYTDVNLAEGTYHYRLKCVDRDDKFTYSAIRQVMIESMDQVRMFPNPVTNGQVNISVPQPETVRIFNNAGLLVVQKQIPAGKSAIRLEHLPAGNYQVMIGNKTRQLIIQK